MNPFGIVNNLFDNLNNYGQIFDPNKKFGELGNNIVSLFPQTLSGNVNHSMEVKYVPPPVNVGGTSSGAIDIYLGKEQTQEETNPPKNYIMIILGIIIVFFLGKKMRVF